MAGSAWKKEYVRIHTEGVNIHRVVGYFMPGSDILGKAGPKNPNGDGHHGFNRLLRVSRGLLSQRRGLRRLGSMRNACRRLRGRLARERSPSLNGLRAMQDRLVVPTFIESLRAISVCDTPERNLGNT